MPWVNKNGQSSEMSPEWHSGTKPSDWTFQQPTPAPGVRSGGGGGGIIPSGGLAPNYSVGPASVTDSGGETEFGRAMRYLLLTIIGGVILVSIGVYYRARHTDAEWDKVRAQQAYAEAHKSKRQRTIDHSDWEHGMAKRKELLKRGAILGPPPPEPPKP